MIIQRKKKNRLYILGLIFLGFVIGILGIVHLRSSLARTTDPSTSDTELKKMVLNLEKEQEDSKKQVTNLEKNISDSQDSLGKIQNTSGQSVEQLKQTKNEAGVLPREGKGVVITLADSNSDSSSNTALFLIHDSDLRDMINLLWLADASACSINNERIIFPTSIDCLINTIMVNDTKLGSPYKISAIVDQAKIKPLLENDDYLSDIKSRIRKNNLIFNTEYRDKIQIPAYSSSLDFSSLN